MYCSTKKEKQQLMPFFHQLCMKMYILEYVCKIVVYMVIYVHELFSIALIVQHDVTSLT